MLGAAGVIGGIAVAVVAAREAPELEVTKDHLLHRHEGRDTWVERADVSATFRDGKDLVLLRTDGSQRARIHVDELPAGRLREALTAQDWPLRDADEFEADFELWADGRPGFTAEENTTLRRRWEDRKDALLRSEADEALAETGLVARVRGNRLQVRRAPKA